MKLRDRSRLPTAMRRERLALRLSIQEIIITPVDTKVSIGTFVQLIRRLTSGPMKGSRRMTGSRWRA